MPLSFTTEVGTFVQIRLLLFRIQKLPFFMEFADHNLVSDRCTGTWCEYLFDRMFRYYLQFRNLDEFLLDSFSFISLSLNLYR